MRKVLKNISSLAIGIILSVFILEIFLHFYKPFEPRIKGKKIILPLNKEYIFHSNGIKGVDSIVIHNKNSLGFRGINPDVNYKNKLTMFFVGGSTTECTACGEKDDWPAVANSIILQSKKNFWSNNAGLDGHSTFGHQILVEDYLIQLKPKYIVFLVGVNDVGREDLAKFEKYHLKKETELNWKQSIVSKSEIIQLIINLKRSKKAMDLDLGHKNKLFKDYAKYPMTEAQIQKEVNKEEVSRIAFRNRLSLIVKTCLDNGIEPIFMTQPTIMGKTYQDSGLNFETMKIRDYSGKAFNTILNSYNSITRNVCKSNNLFCVDLWELLPKNPDYYYDEVHFTKEGSRKMGEIVGKELSLYLNSKTND